MHGVWGLGVPCRGYGVRGLDLSGLGLRVQFSGLGTRA